MIGRRRPAPGIAAIAGRRSSLARRRMLLAAMTAALCSCSLVAIGSARAAETAKLEVGFAPYRLGINSAFTFTVQVGSTTGAVPSATTSIALQMPASMGLSSSQLGLSVCPSETLQANGVAGCPHEAMLGSGKAMVVEADGSEQLDIPTAVTVMMAPSAHEETRLLFYAEGQSDLITQLVFGGDMTGITNPLATLVDATIPPTVGVPGTPPAALTKLAVTLAPRGLMYAKRVNGRTVRYHPKGLAVPLACPHEGLKFGVKLGFADGTSTEAITRLACPDPAGLSRAHGHGGQARRGK